MNTKKYMQTDGAWSELGCPAYPCYIGRDGCGLVSIANILIEMEQYAQYTPATIQPYCKRFMASDCEGTIWSGVPVMLKHYGLTDVMEHKNFSTLWPELAKGNRVVFYIMGPAPGGSKRVKWTSGGHCVCSVEYKYEDGLHKVYMKDSYSNSSLRNGWISYEENIRGACLAIWSGKLVGTPTPPPTPPKPGELVVDGIGGTETVMAMQQAFGVGIDGIISGQLVKWKNYYPSITAISFEGGGSQVIYKLQEWLGLSDPDGILGPNTTKAWQKRLRDYGYFANPQETIDGIIGAKTMKAWQECLNNGLKPKSQPTPPTPSGEHYPGPYPVVKYYLEPGDKGENVIRLQNYLNWYTDGQFFKECGDPDGVYGKNTLKYVNKMLTDFFGPSEADGKVGNKTITKMKEYAKPVGPVPPTPPTPTHTKMIDVSDFQSNIDWAKVKADGVDAAIIRCGGRGGEAGVIYDDSDFFENIKGAYNAGLSVGIYFLTQAITPEEGREEAQRTINRWAESGIPISYPICIDSEDVSWRNPDGTIGYGRANSNKLSKAKRTAVLKAFADECKRQGYKSMIYASTNWLYNQVDMSVLSPIMDVWCAQWASSCTYTGKYIIWQYTNKGSVDGIKGRVDMDECYVEPKKVDPPTPPAPPTPGGRYTGPMPTEAEIRIASNYGIRAGICNWCKDIANGGKYGYKQYTDDPNTHKCPICHPGTGDGWNCIGYPFAAWRHGGGIPCKCSCDVFYNSLADRFLGMSDAEVLASLRKRIGINDIQVIRNGKKEVPEKNRQAGDIALMYTGNEYQHTVIDLGGGYISDDTNGRSKDIMYGVKYANYRKSMLIKLVIRYTGSRNYIKQGDRGDAVLKWQDYLNWWSDGKFYKECGTGDGNFGSNTDKWTILFQEKVMGEGQGDGTVGQKTISAALNVVK